MTLGFSIMQKENLAGAQTLRGERGTGPDRSSTLDGSVITMN